MGLLSNKTTRYGKFIFILIALCCLALAGGSIFGGVYAVIHMTHWAKYVIVVVACLFAFIVGVIGLQLFLFSFSMINSWKSVRDSNVSKGIAGTRLCDSCGRVITKNAEYCEHCGAKQETGLGLKSCPNCKTKNSGNAKFCEHCGFEFKNHGKKEG